MIQKYNRKISKIIHNKNKNYLMNDKKTHINFLINELEEDNK